MREYTNVLKLVGFGNYGWKISMNCKQKNKNILKIHNQSLGETFFYSEDVWDSDIPKIIRILTKYEYGHMDIKEICHKLNKGCRHLNIYNY